MQSGRHWKPNLRSAPSVIWTGSQEVEGEKDTTSSTSYTFSFLILQFKKHHPKKDPSGLIYQTQALVLLTADCVFESQSWHLCPWARHLIIIASYTVEKEVHSALPPSLLVHDTLAYILTNCWRGVTLCSAPGVGGNVPWWKPISVTCSPRLEVAVLPCELGDSLLKQFSFSEYQCQGVCT